MHTAQRCRHLLFAIGASILMAPALEAHEAHGGALEELVVYGRAEAQLGVAQAASEGLVGYDDIRLPPLLRVGELVEAVPGMVATQHSGTGKANQYFLRGFNLDHGTDFSATIDGVPINFRTHGHGQGYLDLNPLIPELVATTHYRKGPYSAAVGDFSSAGSVDFRLYERLPESELAVTYGDYGYRRGLAAGSVAVGESTLTGALDLTGYEGPWVLDENLEQVKAYLAYSFSLGNARARLDLQHYDSAWDSTDQIPRRAVSSGQISDLGFIDPDLGGSTQRTAATFSIDAGRWDATAYLIDYDFQLFSNFTYGLEDPTAGDEFEQRDRRRIFGGRLQTGQRLMLASRDLQLRGGIEFRVDDIREVGLYGTAARQRLDTVRSDAVDERSAGVFGEAELAVTDRLRVIAGLRGDVYDWDVTAERAVNSGSGDDALVSPKLTVAYRASDAVELFGNWGKGFHSNDVRGATIRIDPVSGDPATPVDVLVASEGAELGMRLERGRAFNATLVGFWLALDSELVFVGDAGATEANGATERYGFEASTFLQATDWLALNAAYTYTDAAFRNAPGNEDHIPGAVESTFTLGATAAWSNGLSASTRLRYLGEAPLVESNEVRAGDSVLVNASLAYRRGATELRLDAFNLFDSSEADISYFYPSRLPGEPAEGVEDVHFHPLEPRSLRLSLSRYW